jgi:hypothetical protein
MKESSAVLTACRTMEHSSSGVGGEKVTSVVLISPGKRSRQRSMSAATVAAGNSGLDGLIRFWFDGDAARMFFFGAPGALVARCSFVGQGPGGLTSTN